MKPFLWGGGKASVEVGIFNGHCINIAPLFVAPVFLVIEKIHFVLSSLLHTYSTRSIIDYSVFARLPSKFVMVL